MDRRGRRGDALRFASLRLRTSSRVHLCRPPSRNIPSGSSRISTRPCGGSYPSSTTNLARTVTARSGVIAAGSLPEKRSKRRRQVDASESVGRPGASALAEAARRAREARGRRVRGGAPTARRNAAARDGETLEADSSAETLADRGTDAGTIIIGSGAERAPARRATNAPTGTVKRAGSIPHRAARSRRRRRTSPRRETARANVPAQIEERRHAR